MHGVEQSTISVTTTTVLRRSASFIVDRRPDAACVRNRAQSITAARKCSAASARTERITTVRTAVGCRRASHLLAAAAPEEVRLVPDNHYIVPGPRRWRIPAGIQLGPLAVTISVPGSFTVGNLLGHLLHATSHTVHRRVLGPHAVGKTDSRSTAVAAPRARPFVVCSVTNNGMRLPRCTLPRG